MSYDHERATTVKARSTTRDGSPTKQVHPSVNMLLHMQRTAGNAAVNGLLSRRSAGATPVQRAAAAEEEAAVQAMGAAQYEAVQRHHHHVPPKKEGTNVWNTGEEED